MDDGDETHLCDEDDKYGVTRYVEDDEDNSLPFTHSSGMMEI